uniref:Anaphase-promoting complex subunit 5 n=1 Tax=Kwoniella dejecticola CBS 10117 TaxID=1296121 RepID=A0A1A6A9I2_9TREE|nr:uncharacterized protein I303_02728 [Kwoniella dejecticola CBS 10117]OBR86716.1 hypothetical protein I303_02728 [Kwoniella dejecticola CBS 10117]
MSSPRKRTKIHTSQGRGLSEPQLPLHIALAWIIDRVFPLNDDCQPVPIYSHGFVADILRIIAREVLEIGSKPATFLSLRDELDPLVRKETSQILKRNNKKRSRGQDVEEDYEEGEKFSSWMTAFGDRFKDISEGCTFLDRLEKELRDRLNYADDEEPTELPEPIERHSPLGVFSRTLLNTLRKLSFDETTHLSREIARWCGLDTDGPSIHAGIWSLDRESGMEDSLDKRIKAMQDYQSANASGDYSKALSSLKRFYDYQFPSAGRGQHQHALLNIANFHYSTGGMESALAAVEEATRVTRTAGDKACLHQCISLAQRIKTETTAVAFTPAETIRIRQKPIFTNRLPEGQSPMDVLWSVKPALDLGEPVHIAFRRVHLALGKELATEGHPTEGDKKVSKQWRTGQKLDMAAWNATQAGLWGMLGSDALAEYHEDLALSDLSPWADGRLSVLLSRAARAIDQAEYDTALAMLLDISTLKGMSLSSYHRWSKVVWTVLERRAKLHDDEKSLDHIVSSRAPSDYSKRAGPGGPMRETGHPSPIFIENDNTSDSPSPPPRIPRGIPLMHEYIKDLYKKVEKLQTSGTPPHNILPAILEAVQLSSELGLWSLHRYGVIVLCEVMLQIEGLNMAEKVVGELEKIWDQVLGGNDLECIARGLVCLGKAKIDLALDKHDADNDTNNDNDDGAQDQASDGLLGM